ncbi:MAG: RHS repeat-associated core domain-containing protein [Bacteroidales bacterium]|nr:RHS repeat-associated core domain-containing protein [Bacteroidales bacterium]
METKTIDTPPPAITNVIRYQYDNHLGSACLELDTLANVISYEEYHPFGTTSYRSGSSESEVSLKRYKYVGKERDEETGLYYYGARYYSAWVGRFVSVDPLQDKYPHYTPYQYAGNKPISYIDLDGLEEKKNDEVDKNSSGLTLGGNISSALQDIKSLVPKEYQGSITVDEKTNRISLEGYEKMSTAIKESEGMKLIHDLTTSTNSYLYTVGDSVSSINRESLNKERLQTNPLMTDKNVLNSLDNLSITQRSDIPNSFPENNLPQSGFQGSVRISEGLFWRNNPITNTGKFLYPREKVVFHELKENFFRTEKKMDYLEAHKNAAELAHKFSKETSGTRDSFGGYANHFHHKFSTKIIELIK